MLDGWDCCLAHLQGWPKQWGCIPEPPAFVTMPLVGDLTLMVYSIAHFCLSFTGMIFIDTVV